MFETGIKYQLALLYIQKYPHDLFSIKYLLQNVFNYLFMPPKLRYNFPYILPSPGIRSPLIPGIPLPALYFAERITGLIYTAPIIVFALVPALWHGDRDAAGSIAEGERTLFRGLVAALGGAFLCGFAFFTVFFWASERYLLDFLPPMLLLSVIGFWKLSEALRPRPRARAAVIFLALLLAGVSVVVSNALAVALNSAEFRQLDPQLWRQLNNLFRR